MQSLANPGDLDRRTIILASQRDGLEIRDALLEKYLDRPNLSW